MTWNLKWYEISNDMKSHPIWNLKRHEISNDMKSQMTWNVKSHKISNVMKCQMSWIVNCHKMPNVLKCQMLWNADPDAGSMTPSRNARRYTLRSVQSSPGRSFLSILSNDKRNPIVSFIKSIQAHVMVNCKYCNCASNWNSVTRAFICV